MLSCKRLSCFSVTCLCFLDSKSLSGDTDGVEGSMEQIVWWKVLTLQTSKSKEKALGRPELQQVKLCMEGKHLVLGTQQKERVLQVLGRVMLENALKTF